MVLIVAQVVWSEKNHTAMLSPVWASLNRHVNPSVFWLFVIWPLIHFFIFLSPSPLLQAWWHHVQISLPSFPDTLLPPSFPLHPLPISPFLLPSFLNRLSAGPLLMTPATTWMGGPRHCLSEFINTAYGVPVTMEDLQQGPNTNISTLTDLHNPHNLTCWTAAEGSGGGDWTLTVPLGRRFENHLH